MRVHLIGAVWLSDGQIDYFHEWLRNVLAPRGMGLHAATEIGPPSQSAPAQPNSSLTSELIGQANEQLLPTPLGWGDNDALHLTGHCSGPLGQLSHVAESETFSASSASRAVLLSDSAMGWYRSLMRYGLQLRASGLSEPSIDVVIRPIGWLGRYEQSPQTGVWYTGPHHLHVVGT